MHILVAIAGGPALHKIQHLVLDVDGVYAAKRADDCRGG
jgi:hypothetical protein